MSKILFISNLASRIGSFSVASIAAAQKCEMEFYFAANWNKTSVEQQIKDEKKYGIKLIHLDLERSPYSFNNYKAYQQLITFIKEEKIDYIHCNTPVGGLLGRLAGEKCNVKKVIYQVHGFHFYDGAPMKNWLIYYPIEKWLAKKTDAIIVINKEDYERAESFKLRNNGSVYYVPGVGMDLKQYEIPKEVRVTKRNELCLKETDFALISMGDLIKRKNYAIAIEAIAKVKNTRVHYFICGNGPEEANLRELTKKLGVEKQVHFLGYRSDIKELLKASDAFLFTSKQEGLARSLMEAMASGLPCIASKIRGNTDLLNDTNCGYLCENVDEYVQAIRNVMGAIDISVYRKACLEHIHGFDMNTVVDALTDIYSKEFENNK